ncbi:MAG: 50S ribosome-binding GTPase [Cyclobacteriaceae bacterium]|nr:50S ribosome-binding GTPase [Cyclobacteriaceae bacterium]MCH8515701.1 50S ribosome-binding GTPase [Cyclobacteriaceae bacterium]
MELLKFFTAGSVDDGKSTLIGRLLYDSKAVSGDILAAIEASSKKRSTELDLSLLTDGLRAEREQGITIDVAYKYFNTDQRKFIIADTPGHEQYTRNMVTAASNSSLAVILIDARKGITDQSRRHSLISHLLGVKQVVLAINKMDLVDFSQNVFDQIVTDYEALTTNLDGFSFTPIPVSAALGDNVVNASENMNWYEGLPLLHFLESVSVEETTQHQAARLQIQYVIRPKQAEYHDYRAYAGRLNGGALSVGDEVVALPSGLRARVKSIAIGDRSIEQASSGQSITLEIDQAIDLSRGDYLFAVHEGFELNKELRANLCWMDSRSLRVGSTWYLQQGSRKLKAKVAEILSLTDINRYEKIAAPQEVKLNEIAEVKFRLADYLAYDAYAKNKNTGSAILVDESSNQTSGALMFL